MTSFLWLRATFENGMPLDYRIVLKITGWKKVDQEAIYVTYQKGNHAIEIGFHEKAFEVFKK